MITSACCPASRQSMIGCCGPRNSRKPKYLCNTVSGDKLGPPTADAQPRIGVLPVGRRAATDLGPATECRRNSPSGSTMQGHGKLVVASGVCAEFQEPHAVTRARRDSGDPGWTISGGRSSGPYEDQVPEYRRLRSRVSRTGLIAKPPPVRHWLSAGVPAAGTPVWQSCRRHPGPTRGETNSRPRSDD